MFSQYVDTLTWLCAQSPPGLVGMLHGAQSMAERSNLVRRFAEAPPGSQLYVSLHAGGVGLNLPEATHVVMFDRWWNPAVEAQAVAHALRFKRQIPLTVTSFVSSRTVEERIEDILSSKRNEAQAFDAALTNPTRLSLSDLRRFWRRRSQLTACTLRKDPSMGRIRSLEILRWTRSRSGRGRCVFVT